MVQSQARMMQQHSRTTVTHDLLHFFFHLRAVAVDEAFTACTLLLLKRTFVKTHKGVGFEFDAFWTEFLVGLMMSITIDVDHGINGSFLTSNSRMLYFRLSFRHTVTSSKLNNEWVRRNIRIRPQICGISESVK
jgi:hypothetical protein